MLLATRPDLTWIVLMGIVVLFLWFVRAGLEMHNDIGGDATPAQRRNVIESAVSISIAMALAAYLLPDAISQLESDDSESRILRIASDETYTVESGDNETWVAVYNDGLLNLNGSMDLEGST